MTLSNNPSGGRVPALPRPNTYADWLRVGFFTAMGAALLALLAVVVVHLSRAVLEIITPFALATLLAFLLDPLIDRLQRQGLQRGLAVALVFGVFLLLLILVGALAIPALINEASQLTQDGPQYIDRLHTLVDTFLARHHHIGAYKLPRNFDVLFGQISSKASDLLSGSAGHIADFLLGSITTLLDAIITLIVTLYLLLDLDRMRARVYYLLPANARRPVSAYAGDIGRIFAEYLRGLVIVCAFYGAATVVFLFGLSLVHSDIARYALLVGVAGGLLYTVPYLGPIVTAVVTFLVAFAAGGIGFGGAAVLGTLALNQIFDNVVTPRVVGGGVGLHPVASLFALTLGGTLFGLWGLLLSVPVAASVQVVLFRLFPKLTTPTPSEFLNPQDFAPGEGTSARNLEGGAPTAP